MRLKKWISAWRGSQLDGQNTWSGQPLFRFLPRDSLETRHCSSWAAISPFGITILCNYYGAKWKMCIVSGKVLQFWGNLPSYILLHTPLTFTNSSFNSCKNQPLPCDRDWWCPPMSNGGDVWWHRLAFRGANCCLCEHPCSSLTTLHLTQWQWQNNILGHK